LREHINSHGKKISPTENAMVVRQLVGVSLVKRFMLVCPGKKGTSANE
jgi:hypothetical protein